MKAVLHKYVFCILLANLDFSAGHYHWTENYFTKTDPVQFKWSFGEGLLKDKFAFFEASKNPIPKRRNLLATRPFL